MNITTKRSVDKMADRWIAELLLAGYDYEQILHIIDLARRKFLALKKQQKHD